MNAFARGNVAAAQKHIRYAREFIAEMRQLNPHYGADYFATVDRELRMAEHDLDNAVALDDATEAAE